MIRSVRIELLTLLLLSSSLALSQNFPTPFKQSFSSAGSAQTQFDFDVPDTAYYDSTAVNAVIYRDLLQTTWNSALMPLFYQTYTTHTYSGTINYTPPNDVLE